MATQVQFRRGTTSQNNAFTGAQGELTIDNEVWTIRIHDGVTAGGKQVPTLTATQTFTNKTMSTNSIWNGNAVGLGYGGTGASLSGVAGAIVYSTGSAMAMSLAGTSGQVLTSGGTSGPTWVNASALSTGTATTATTATNIAGGSAGYLVYQEDTNTTSFIAPGTEGYILKSTGASTPPGWVTSDLTIGSTSVSVGTTQTSFAGLNILAATGTSHWTIPVGTTLQRPGSPAAGMIRYNSTQSTFEGYSSGAWSSLGGVKSVDALTYIIAETSAGASNGDLDFYAEDGAGTAATQVGQWNRTNLKDYTGTIVGTQTTQNVFDTTATTINFGGAATTIDIGAGTGTTAIKNNATVAGTLGVTGATTLSGALNANGGIAVDSTAFTVADTTGNTAIAGTLTVTGATVLNGGLTMDTNKFTVADTTGNTAIGGTLAVTGATTLSSALTYGGVALSNSVTGTGSMVLSASPTFTGTANFAAIGTTGNTSVGGNLTVTGDLTVNGTTTTINSTTISVDDKNIELGSVATPTDTTADGGGITLKGATDKTFNWVDATDAWTSSEHMNLLTGKAYYINGTSVLNATTLGSGVTGSSLTSVGTIGTGVWQGTVVAGQYGGTGVANTGKTITLGGNLTTSGAYATTLTMTGATSVTLPTTGTLATLAGSESLSNKTITSSSFSGTTGAFSGQITSTATTGTAPLVIASTTKVANLNVEQVDGYHAAEANTASNIVVRDSSSNINITGATFSGSTSGTGKIVAPAIAGTGTVITLPGVTSTLATLAGTETLTNKTISGASNTLSNIANASLTNSSVTVGSTAISLGSSATTIAGLSSVTSTSFVGALTGNASTATTAAAWTTARTITLGGDLSGSVSISGSADVTLTATIAANSVALGTDTTGAYVVDCVAGTGISLSETANNAEGNTVTITNSGVTSIVAGTGISISGATGAVTVTNTITNTNQLTNGAGFITAVPNSSTQVSSLGVGTAASGTTGEIRATSQITAYYSDDRLKTKTGNIQNALEKVLSLDGFHYHANETAVALGYDASKEEVGLSAQQVQAVLPEVIAPAPIDPQYMTLHYERLVPLLVEAIKEQQKQIEELKAKLGN